MKPQPDIQRSVAFDIRWSNRLLILSLVGIFFLTLFPFRFVMHARIAPNRLLFLLQGWGKDSGAFDAFLNVLLFVPFGFAIAEKCREAGQSWRATLFSVSVSGALLSYGVEFLQLFIPMRDSGWEDVITNTAGSSAGFILFDMYGRDILRWLFAAERILGRWLTWPKAAFTIAVYFLLWCALSIPLQMKTRLDDWTSPNAWVVLGNDLPGQRSVAWKGDLFLVQIWDRAIPAPAAQKLVDGEMAGTSQPGLLAEYDFSKSNPLADQRNFLSSLTWFPARPASGDPSYLTLDGTMWLKSSSSVPNLVQALQRTNQFSIRIICRPADLERLNGRIFGIWQRPGVEDLRIREEDTTLIFFMLTPLARGESDLVWHIPRVFEPNTIRDILFSYDGSRLHLYADGKQAARMYRLGPGTALLAAFRNVRTGELDGYHYIYYFLVFFPGGVLIGIYSKRLARFHIAAISLLIAALVLPALAVELVLVEISRRPLSISNIVLSVLLALGGGVWINTDGRKRSLAS